jgi:poly(3-hydroxybutyrate) depolymerase
MLSTSTRLASIAALAVIVGTSACQAWKVEDRPVEVVVRQGRSDPVAITMNDKRWIVLSGAHISNDSVVGMRVAGNTKGKGRTALSLGGVRVVQTRRFSFLRTAGLGIALWFVPAVYRFAVVD